MAATRPRVSIHIDPFFDGAGTRRSTTLPGYRSAEQEAFATIDPRGTPLISPLAGRSIASVLPGRYGATIVPPATAGGVPEGFSPNVMPGTKVIIDPHINGDRVQLDVGTITPDSMAGAMEVAGDVMPNPRDNKQRRFKAAAAYHALSEMEAAGETTTKPLDKFEMVEEDYRESDTEIEARRKAAMAPAPQQIVGGHVISSAQRPSAFSRFGRKQVAVIGSDSLAVPTTAGTPPTVKRAATPTLAPTIRVRYELEYYNAAGSPLQVPQDAAYHFVQKSDDGDAIMLGWDMRYSEQPMFVPPYGDDAPRTAISIDGDPAVYLVKVFPMRYSRVQLPGSDAMYAILQLVIVEEA